MIEKPGNRAEIIGINSKVGLISSFSAKIKIEQVETPSVTSVGFPEALISLLIGDDLAIVQVNKGAGWD